MFPGFDINSVDQYNTSYLQKVCRTQFSDEWDRFPRDRRFRSSAVEFLKYKTMGVLAMPRPETVCDEDEGSKEKSKDVPVFIFGGDHNGQWSPSGKEKNTDRKLHEIKSVDMTVYNAKDCSIPERAKPECHIDCFISNQRVNGVQTVGKHIFCTENYSDHLPVVGHMNIGDKDVSMLSYNCMFNYITVTPVALTSLAKTLPNEYTNKNLLVKYAESLKEKWATEYHRVPTDKKGFKFMVGGVMMDNIDCLYNKKIPEDQEEMKNLGIGCTQIEEGVWMWDVPLKCPETKRDATHRVKTSLGTMMAEAENTIGLNDKTIKTIKEWHAWIRERGTKKFKEEKAKSIYNIVLRYDICFLTEFDDTEFELDNETKTISRHLAANGRDVYFFPRKENGEFSKSEGLLIAIKKTSPGEGKLEIVKDNRNAMFPYAPYVVESDNNEKGTVAGTPGWMPRPSDQRRIGNTVVEIHGHRVVLGIFHFQTPSKWRKAPWKKIVHQNAQLQGVKKIVDMYA